MDAFADGFFAGYRRGWKAARAELHRRLQGIADPRVTSSGSYAEVPEALTEELLSREAARREPADQCDRQV